MSFTGVGLAGRAGSGKSTIAKAILALRPDLRHGSFAQSLKDDLAKLDIVKGDPGFREVAQAYGTDFARVKYGTNYWVQRLIDREGSMSGLVIDDMRFQNETDVCKSAGLYTVVVDTPAEIRTSRLGYECPEHASEVPPSGVHLVLRGYDNTPEELAETILAYANIPEPAAGA